MLNKNSALVKIFVEQVQQGKLTTKQIMPLNLKELVVEVLQDKKQITED